MSHARCSLVAVVFFITVKSAQAQVGWTIDGVWHEGAAAGPSVNPVWFNESPVFFGQGTPEPARPYPYDWQNGSYYVALMTRVVMAPGNIAAPTYRKLPWQWTWTEDHAVTIPDPSSGLILNLASREPANPNGPPGGLPER